MNFVRIGCHRPTSNEEWSYRDDGPSFFPPDEYVAFHTTEYALRHYHRHPLLGQLTAHGCIVGNPQHAPASSCPPAGAGSALPLPSKMAFEELSRLALPL